MLTRGFVVVNGLSGSDGLRDTDGSREELQHMKQSGYLIFS